MVNASIKFVKRKSPRRRRAETRAATLAALRSLSAAELQNLVGARIFFADHAPRQVRSDFLLRQRLAAELLE